ncbi:MULTISPECIES: YdcF family protein [unclassified Bacillus (in: firmicutes)]|uniref:YdcF family protein n=1 Tax=unclassified Bacillus (in: firmicutes) TaxID=185979 RepID=UPI0008E0E1CE|nr:MULTISPECIES: YdcF family protein [unclassified Bacillus (in: firmicutes)]SFB23440.1 Uncharacterized SAM-binding protein YcdF, DUF218 family [Bacillus sp. UNCCL13]SFQ87759.1 Uncharacterized SAM-binding protein YcdF, DUF218 family [Bacillus sp. cl95]
MKKIILGIVGLGFIYVAVLHFQIVQASKGDVPENADYMIVLGARVKGTVPSLALKCRIDAAAEYAKKNKKTIVIASGGKGPGEEISEAESIRRELLKQGIEESRIILEDESTDTYENVENSKAYIPDEANSGILITNDFHIFRAVEIAKDKNLEVVGLPAETPLVAVPKSYIREYMAITKFYLKKYFF